MTHHALERLSERFPDIDAKSALTDIKDALVSGEYRVVGQSVTGEKITESYLTGGTPVFPIVTEDGGVKTVLTEGMETPTTTGRITLTPSFGEPDANGIRTVLKNQIVTEPGAYRMSMEWYHSQCCAGPSVSSTGIRLAALQSPHAFWKTSDLNPNRYPEKEPGDSLILGRAAHSLILGDEIFDEHFCYVPKDAPRRPTATQVKAFERDGKWSDAAKEGAEFWAEFDAKAAGRMLLKEEQVQKIQYMAENLAANPEAREVLVSDMFEICMIWQDEATGLWIKSRPDSIPSNGFDFGDLKTFSPKSRDLIISSQRSVTDYGYPLQMGLAVMGAELTLGSSAETCALVFVQTSEPYEVIPIEVDEESLYWAKVWCRHGINLISHGMKTGEWPGVAKKIIKYSYPPSMLHRFAEMQREGLLPSLEA